MDAPQNEGGKMTDTKHRRKVKCGKCKETKYCYQVEIQIAVFRERALATKAYDWCCLDCINKFADSIEHFQRQKIPPAGWLLEDKIEKDVLKEIEEEKDVKE